MTRNILKPKSGISNFKKNPEFRKRKENKYDVDIKISTNKYILFLHKGLNLSN
jgi:hypothetical protein